MALSLQWWTVTYIYLSSLVIVVQRFCIFLLNLRIQFLWAAEILLFRRKTFLDYLKNERYVALTSQQYYKQMMILSTPLSTAATSTIQQYSNQPMHLFQHCDTFTEIKYLIIPSNSNYSMHDSPVINSASPSLKIIVFLNKLITYSYFSICFRSKTQFQKPSRLPQKCSATKLKRRPHLLVWRKQVYI